jgi:hypothetical protein
MRELRHVREHEATDFFAAAADFDHYGLRGLSTYGRSIVNLSG